MKTLARFFKYIYNQTHKGFYFLCLVFSRGFYFYFYIMACILKFFFKKSEKVSELVVHYKNRQQRPEYFFLLLFSSVLLISTFYVVFYDSNEIVKLDDMIVEESMMGEDTQEKVEIEEDNVEVPSVNTNIETNLFKIYGNKKINEIDFNELRLVNGDVKAWLIVDGTNINYPIVQTTDNDYYLKYNFKKKKTTNGWPFMDYRNSSDMTNANTIFYGHNLLNKTAFGSISNLFTENWLMNSSHKILVVTEYKIYTYEIFSIYYSEPVSYYLQTKFATNESKLRFFENLKSKSEVAVSTNFIETDRIITLSTCTDDNKGRKVVHAKLISESYR